MRVVGFVIIALLITSCSLFKSGQRTYKSRPMSDQDKLEFSYAFTEATKQQLSGNYKQAVSLYLKCIQANPRSAASYYQLSNIFSMSESKKEAISFARAAVDIDKTNYWYLVQLARLYQSAGIKDSTIQIYKQIVKNDPLKNDLRYDLALMYLDNEDYKNALSELNIIENSVGVSEQTSVAKHQVYIAQKKYDKAEEEINKLIALNPHEVKYYGILAEMFGDLGQKDKALTQYEKIFAVDPENTMGLFSISELYVALKDTVNAAKIYDKIVGSNTIELEDKIKIIGNLLSNDESFKQYKTHLKDWVLVIVNKYPNDFQPSSLLTNYFIKCEDYVSAASILSNLVKKENDNGVFWEQLLYIENILQRYDSLIVHADSALMMFPRAPSFYLLKGMAQHQKALYRDATKTLETGIIYVTEKEQAIQFNTFLGESFYKLDQFQRAEVYFDKVIADDPMNVYVLNNYAYYLAVSDRELDKAEKMAEQAVKIEPESSTYLDTYAWVLYKKKNFAKAKEVIEKAYKNDGQDNGEIAEHFGDILYCNEQKEHAMELWRIAINLGQNRDLIEKKMLGYRCK